MKNMKIVLVLIAICAAVGYSLISSYSEDALANLTLDNIEALAAEGASPCGGPKEGGECKSQNTVNCKDLSGCQ